VGSGLTIPGLNVRRAETTVELPSGGSLMMAGLLQTKSRQNLDKVPGLADMPVLGSLFRSRDFLNDETELVIIITPMLVKPVAPGQLQTPADGLKIAHDARTVFLGKLNEVYRPNPAPPAPRPPPTRAPSAR
jgi:pilus assembly protein CpaC